MQRCAIDGSAIFEDEDGRLVDHAEYLYSRLADEAAERVS